MIIVANMWHVCAYLGTRQVLDIGGQTRCLVGGDSRP